MVSLLAPSEGELICDPAAGSGGFLIRTFEHIRDQIAADIQAQKDAARADIEAKALDADQEERQIDEAFARLNRELLPSGEDNRPIDTRVGRLAWSCIFGCDGEPRAARTAKMNMIMHGDGHGGIHYHDGLVDINGIFPERFHIVITNPPFGANVGDDQKVGGSEETRVPNDLEYRKRCKDRYGAEWEKSHKRMLDAAAARTNILDLFEIGRGKSNRATEIVFVERCLSLLRPGGRMGIVLPDGNLNNPSLSWLRRWSEGKARILAVVSLPEETFRSADATVKASIVFFQRFTEDDEAAWDTAWSNAQALHDPAFNAQRDALCADYAQRIRTGENAKVADILDRLKKFGIERSPPAWSAGAAPEYPRGVGPTRVSRPQWNKKVTDAKRVTELRRKYRDAFNVKARGRSEALLRELQSKLRDVDGAHNGALWTSVRAEFDYPVFVAAPKAVGITSTGETGELVENQLPKILEAFRAFEGWLSAGAKATEVPGFLLPSAA
jgi:type I restriction enzyme M protein